MAGNNSIQFVRGTSSKRASHTETSLAGQPIYETDTNRLYVGDGETSVNDLTAVEASAADIAENVKDQNNGAGIKIWIGTQAEFEDLEADEDTIYYITDIVSVLEVDEALKTLKEQLTSGAFKVGKAGEADNVKSQVNGKNIDDIFETNGTTVKKATKLATARNMQVDLASGNSQAFDGSADAEEIGVAGVLPVANGGTGASNLNNIKVGSAGSADRAAKLSAARNLQVNVASGNAQSFDGSGNATDIGVKGVLPVANGGTGQSNLDNVTVGNVKSTINDKAISSIFEDNGTTVREATHATRADRATADENGDPIFATDLSKLTLSTANGWTQITTKGTLPGAGVYLVGATINSNEITLAPQIMVFDGTNPAIIYSVMAILPVALYYMPDSGHLTGWVLVGIGDTDASSYDVDSVYYKRIA